MKNQHLVNNQHIANRGNDKLFYTHDSVIEGVSSRMGFVQMADGTQIEVMIDSVLSRGYWEPVKQNR